MSFYNIFTKYARLDFDSLFGELTKKEVEKALKAGELTINQFLSLLSPQAEEHLEYMAERAHSQTLQNFGKTIQLYTPIYLSNYCVNECVYCGFNVKNDVVRKKLELDELEEEAKLIFSWGLRHVLVLTGESREESSLDYIKSCIRILKKYFSSISIEIYPLASSEYKELICEGIDGLTIYQETYDRELYNKVHLDGPKRDYLFRLDAPERALSERIRQVNIGVLLGLGEWRRDIFFMGLHAQYLLDKFQDAEISISVPRIRPQTNDFVPLYNVTKQNMVQAVLALRIFLPRVGITLSTRESPSFRENLIPLGVTRMSAASTTKVGGHTVIKNETNKLEQFEVYDTRSVDEIKEMLLIKGYEPVLKDWVGV